ncbi:MAG: M28 family peptidase, partial [Candidatus Thorarchaeota archaeon]
MGNHWDQVETENIFQHILKTEGEKHPLYSLEKLEECADYILSEFESYGLATNVHEFKVDGFDHTFRNIEGFIGDGKGPELLIVSHYDTVRHAPGANDNGTAIAVMLEAARILVKADIKGNVRFVSFNLEEGNPVRTEQLTRTARSNDLVDEQGRYLSWHTTEIMKRWIAILNKLVLSETESETAASMAIAEVKDDLQENELALLKKYESLFEGTTLLNWPGRTALMGSHAWVQQAVSEKKEIIGVLCLETMGYTSKEKNSQKFPDQVDPRMFEIFETQKDLTVGDFLSVIADGNSKSLASSFCEQCKDDSITLPFACLKADFGFKEAAYAMPDILRSDHAPFWKENIPALLITDSANFRYPYYHTPADTIDKLDFNFLTKICK